MTEAFQKQIEQEARQAVTELLAEAKLKKGDVFVVGCSPAPCMQALPRCWPKTASGWQRSAVSI